MSDFTEWTADDATQHIAVPEIDDDKYTRGVLGIVTGSEQYPGAAVLTVEAALRTGVGMVRYLGPPRPADLVLRRRPEAVTSPGRVQAWLLGSGMDPVDRDIDSMADALAQGLPTVLDGGALDLHDRTTGSVVITPHYRELARLLGLDPEVVAADPPRWARSAADQLGVTVLLKGHTTYVAGASVALSVRGAPTWLATAGAGDALAGILGALIATHAERAADEPSTLAKLAATAALVHGLAAKRASAGGPLTVLDLCASVSPTIAELISQR